MEEKLKTLLDNLNLEKTYYPFFKEGKLIKLQIKEKDKEWVFFLELNQLLPVELYDHLNKLLIDNFPDLNKIEIKYQIKDVNYSNIQEYIVNIFSKLNKQSLLVYKDRELKINKMIELEVYNQAEFNKIDKYLPQINKMLEGFGIDKKMSLYINETKRESIKQEIKEEIKIKVPKKEEDSLIYGSEIKSKNITKIKDILGEVNNIVVEAYIFGLDFFSSSKSNFKIITLKISDNTNSIFAKLFSKDDGEYKRLIGRLKVGKWFKIRGYVKHDQYAKDFVLNIRDLLEIPSQDLIKEDQAEIKRVELHAHTHMSQMDGLVNVKDLIDRAKKWGHSAIAITDHNSCQAFPEAYFYAKDIKIIYGVEIGMIDDSIDIVLRETTSLLEEETYVVFDVETTGLNATSGDSIIEVGAVKLHQGKIIDTFSELINPNVKLEAFITNLTKITDEMLKDKRKEEEVIKDFKQWIKDLPLVAQNAKFDLSFLENAYLKYNLGELNNPVIDTLELSRTIDSSYKTHSLSALVKRYDIPFEEKGHHRAEYDAKATALVFDKMLKKLIDQNLERISDLNKLVTKDDLHKIGQVFHLTLLAKNNKGLKNLFKIISLSNTKYLYKTPRILRSELKKHKEGLLIGSACYNGEVFLEAKSKNEEEMNKIIQFYDYIEIQPLSNYSPLLQKNEFPNEEKLIEHLKKIIQLSKRNKRLVVGTGDVHHLDEKDKIYREIIINQKVPGGGKHPFSHFQIKEIPSQHFRTTKEMLEGFPYLEEVERKEIVITNSNKIADMIEEVTVIKKDLYTPTMEDSDQIVTKMVQEKVKEIYGQSLPKIVEKRIKEELDSIIGNGFDVIYLISEKLVKKSNNDGYLVGSRGSVGSSFVATMMGITEVNPLPAHYICPNCQTSIFEKEGRSLGNIYKSGYDLPDLKCVCGTMMKKEGQDMPFATFLGFKGDKVPDIDLNFSGDYQMKAHNYTKELFGEDKVFRAGTIGTVADKTAFGFVKGYMEDKEISFNYAEQSRLALGCVGVKRTTGQHPGGIIVIPREMEIFDFTPYQFPADDLKSSWFTTHFDFHAIDNNILKLDILGHDDPTALKMLEDITGVLIKDIPFDDQKVLSLFSSPKALKVKEEDIMCATGTLGIPEFGTSFVIEMLKDTKPKTFAELVKISGLSHGTDVWLGNAKELIKDNICEFKDVIGCRDDIMVYLMYNGLKPIDAFNIMEFVRKGKASKDPKKWALFAKIMEENDIPDWYIKSCQKIKYMFPKAHATAYVMMAFRVAWFKVYKPLYYYATHFSVRVNDFDIMTMIEGYDAIKNKIIELNNKGYDKTNKEILITESLQCALEMLARGYKFGNIDLYKSDSFKFLIDEENKTLIPPFRTLDGLGDIVARKIVSERQKSPFISIEDLQGRGKVSQTIIDQMRLMGILDGLPESSQLSLFDL
ncbi:MAG: PolC-type DNA polymerase III [Bacilli bacterium]|jgi:DNA polymerase-3 subunit alpha (Gram-positive type)